ncbi:hypothetical protein NFI96_023968 [Prochilodus magdalenae]|nr:hypothetical protein NFI96_023968 [Prochilodus magdalenae]
MEILIIFSEASLASWSSPRSQRNASVGKTVCSKRSLQLNDEDEDDDDEGLSNSKSKKKNRVTTTPQKFSVFPDRRTTQELGLRLRNLLKLPKAHKWCIYEWFYSNIDRALFEGDNDFCLCLNESFPCLKTRKLTRVEWSTIRRLMGKPRRCSSAFLEEERAALNQRRQKIRLLQQRRTFTDLSDCSDLPDHIPLPLVIGTKITARLRGSLDGLFTGQIDAVDTSSSTYRVTFERSGLGTHTVPDYEVLSSEPPETMPLSAFVEKRRPVQNKVPQTPTQAPYTSSAEFMSPWSKLSGTDDDTLGGFPVKFLVQVTRLSKILSIKKDHIKQLREMNTEAEKQKSYSEPLKLEFQKKYASVVLDVEQLNRDLNKVLNEVQQFSSKLLPDQCPFADDPSTALRRRCEGEAQEIVRQANELPGGQRYVHSQDLTQLISNLTMLLLQIKCLSEGDDLNSFEFKSLTESLNDIKSSLDSSNVRCFQNNVEIHVAHIQSGLCQTGNLHAFTANCTGTI